LLKRGEAPNMQRRHLWWFSSVSTWHASGWLLCDLFKVYTTTWHDCAW